MKPGSRVICVNGDFSQYGPRLYRDFQNLPQEGVQYTIREMKWEAENNTARVLLEEIENPPVFIDLLQASAEPGFDGKRFREIEPPLVEAEVEREVVYARL